MILSDISLGMYRVYQQVLDHLLNEFWDHFFSYFGQFLRLFLDNF